MSPLLQAAAINKNCAWASFNTPLSVTDLTKFCSDIERLFRINPMLEFKKWQNLSDNRFHLQCTNTSQEQTLDIDVELDIKNSDDGFEIRYSCGLKNKTQFKIEATKQGSKLTITDSYHRLSESEQQARLNEVDKSIIVWANYLQRFMIMWQRWSRIAPWRWYMSKVWQPMKPSGRRITYMLLWITGFEILLITLGVTIYYLEYT